jgi:hypothetical protein
VRQARSAIARAREADAEYYEPDLLRQAEKPWKPRWRPRADPAAREALARPGRADGPRRAVPSPRPTWRAPARLKAALLEEKGDRFLPEEFERAVAGIPEVERLYGQGELVDAREKAYSTLAEMSGLLERLQERKRWVETLKHDIDQNLKQAEELGAHTRAPEAFALANRLYLQGIDEYQAIACPPAKRPWPRPGKPRRRPSAWPAAGGRKRRSKPAS